jgi:hypothetical protein
MTILCASDAKLGLLYGSTAFLIGPKRQVTMMLDPVRIYATAIYLASIIIALFCALYVSCMVALCLFSLPSPPFVLLLYYFKPHQNFKLILSYSFLHWSRFITSY